jgi:hypothetical protein
MGLGPHGIGQAEMDVIPAKHQYLGHDKKHLSDLNLSLRRFRLFRCDEPVAKRIDATPSLLSIPSQLIFANNPS